MTSSKWTRIHTPSTALAVLLLLAMAIPLTACEGDGGTGDGTTSPSPARTPEVITLESGDEAVWAGEVSGQVQDTITVSFVEVPLGGERVPAFSPTIITVLPGQEIRLRVEDRDPTDSRHNLTITELDIDEDFANGETKTLRITMPESGTLAFFCKYHSNEDEHQAGEFRIIT
jgi:plastocyanin